MGLVAIALLAVGIWVVFEAGTFGPNLPPNCTSKRSPDPLFPIPAIVIAAAASFVAGGIAARIRVRLRSSS
jgi:hypothetical protein